MMIAEGFTCQRYGFNVGADKFSLLTIENGKTSIMRLSEWTLISQSQKSHSDRLLAKVLLYSYQLQIAINALRLYAGSYAEKGVVYPCDCDREMPSGKDYLEDMRFLSERTVVHFY